MKKASAIKSVFTVVLIAICFACSGCGTEINVTERRYEDGWVFALDIRLDKRLENELEQSASEDKRCSVHGREWTVEHWLCDYISIVAEMNNFTSHFVEKYIDAENGKYGYLFDITVLKDTASKEINEALELESDMSIKTNLFLRTISVVCDDRFNWWVREFSEVLDRFESDNPAPNDTATMMGILLFGCGSYSGESGKLEYVEELPGLTDAFPAAAPAEYRDVILQNFWYASKKMRANSSDKLPAENSDGSADTYGAYYVYRKKASDGDTVVEYDYYRADPTGWYIVAVLLGGITVVIVIVASRYADKRKNASPPPKLKDSFPYDPFADDDDNNPFAGY